MLRKVFLVLAALLYSTLVYSFEVARVDIGSTRISLYNEPCAFSSIINLPGRAVWLDKNKIYKGCFGVDQVLGVVVLYFMEDRSITILPLDQFVKVSRL